MVRARARVKAGLVSTGVVLLGHMESAGVGGGGSGKGESAGGAVVLEGAHGGKEVRVSEGSGVEFR